MSDDNTSGLLQSNCSKGACKTIGDFRYNFENFIGKGSFATVYIGFKLGDRTKKYAIKVIDHKKLQGKQREALDAEIEIHKQITNDAIVKLESVRKTDNNYYLILEYCEGKDLNSYLRSKGKISEIEVQYMLHSLKPAFEYLCEQKIIHRDLKLKNLLRSKNKENSPIKICDFGTAK